MRGRRCAGAILSAAFLVSSSVGMAKALAVGQPAAIDSASAPPVSEGPLLGAKRDSSGIALVGDEPIQAQGLTEGQAAAFDKALTAALENPDDLGYPWVDPSTGTLELATATPK